MFVGTLTQSTKSAKHCQFSLRAYKLFYQAICDFNLLTRAATHGNDSQPTWEFCPPMGRGFTKFYLPLLEQKVGFEPTRAEPTAYKTVPINHYGTSAYLGIKPIPQLPTDGIEPPPQDLNRPASWYFHYTKPAYRGYLFLQLVSSTKLESLLRFLFI